MSLKIKAIFLGLKVAGVPKETRDIMWEFWVWLSGKKLVIGAVLATLVDITQGMLLLFPVLQDQVVQLGFPQASVALVFTGLSRGFLWLGMAHKIWKGWFGDPKKPEIFDDNPKP